MNEKLSVYLVKGTKDKISKVAGRQGISTFVREAIEEKLHGTKKPKK